MASRQWNRTILFPLLAIEKEIMYQQRRKLRLNK